MKCPSCNKFAAYEEPEVEVNDSSVEGNSVTVEGRMVLRSECCSEELKEWNFTLEAEVEHDIPEGKEDEHELSVECDDAEGSDYYSGKPGTPARYRKHMYAVTAKPTVSCSCGFKTDLELKDELQASGFDELT